MGREDESDIILENLIRFAPPSLQEDLMKLIVSLNCKRWAEVLEKLLMDRQEDHRIRVLAARSLGKLGKRESLPVLIAALDDTIPSVRHEAISALGALRSADACPALMRLLESGSRHVRGMAARSLIKINGIPPSNRENIGILTRLLCSGDMRIKDSLLSIGTPAVAALNEMLDSDIFSTRSQAAQALALRVRWTADRMPAESSIFPWLDSQGITAKSISKLYSFKVAYSGKTIGKVENSGFDSVSETLCGEHLHSLGHFQLPQNDFVFPNSDEIIENDIMEKGISGTICLKDFLSRNDIFSLRLMGRTLVAFATKANLAIKLCAKEGDEVRLLHEARMQRLLQGLSLCSIIPLPMGGIISIDGLPSWLELELGHSRVHGICYAADPGYFRYLSDPRLSWEETRSGMVACAHDLAWLMGIGLVHTSLIPLFHNRERACGKECDYRWNRKLAGRVDNWIESCLYPNLRLSGIADLEHLEQHSQVSSKEMQSYAGEHLFSISLVLGCYFCKRGPFDPNALSKILEECFYEYYHALTASDPAPMDDAIDWDHLALRMAEEMGGGYPDDEARAAADPHLGLHNGPFPIPELLRAVHIASTFAVMELQSRSSIG